MVVGQLFTSIWHSGREAQAASSARSAQPTGQGTPQTPGLLFAPSAGDGAVAPTYRYAASAEAGQNRYRSQTHSPAPPGQPQHTSPQHHTVQPHTLLQQQQRQQQQQHQQQQQQQQQLMPGSGDTLGVRQEPLSARGAGSRANQAGPSLSPPPSGGLLRHQASSCASIQPAPSTSTSATTATSASRAPCPSPPSALRQSASANGLVGPAPPGRGPLTARGPVAVAMPALPTALTAATATATVAATVAATAATGSTSSQSPGQTPCTSLSLAPGRASERVASLPPAALHGTSIRTVGAFGGPGTEPTRTTGAVGGPGTALECERPAVGGASETGPEPSAGRAVSTFERPGPTVATAATGVVATVTEEEINTSVEGPRLLNASIGSSLGLGSLKAALDGLPRAFGGAWGGGGGGGSHPDLEQVLKVLADLSNDVQQLKLQQQHQQQRLDAARCGKSLDGSSKTSLPSRLLGLEDALEGKVSWETHRSAKIEEDSWMLSDSSSSSPKSPIHCVDEEASHSTQRVGQQELQRSLQMLQEHQQSEIEQLRLELKLLKEELVSSSRKQVEEIKREVIEEMERGWRQRLQVEREQTSYALDALSGKFREETASLAGSLQNASKQLLQMRREQTALYEEFRRQTRPSNSGNPAEAHGSSSLTPRDRARDGSAGSSNGNSNSNKISNSNNDNNSNNSNNNNSSSTTSSPGTGGKPPRRNGSLEMLRVPTPRTSSSSASQNKQSSRQVPDSSGKGSSSPRSRQERVSMSPRSTESLPASPPLPRRAMLMPQAHNQGGSPGPSLGAKARQLSATRLTRPSR